MDYELVQPQRYNQMNAERLKYKRALEDIVAMDDRPVKHSWDMDLWYDDAKQIAEQALEGSKE